MAVISMLDKCMRGESRDIHTAAAVWRYLPYAQGERGEIGDEIDSRSPQWGRWGGEIRDGEMGVCMYSSSRPGLAGSMRTDSPQRGG